MPQLAAQDREMIAKTILFQKDDLNLQDFEAYFEYYDSIVSRILYPAFNSSHDGLLDCIKKLYADPKITRKMFRDSIFTKGSHVPERLQEEAIRAIIQVAFMFDCDIEDEQRPTRRIDEFVFSAWRSNEAFSSFISRSFPTEAGDQYTPSPNDIVVEAWRIKQRRITIQLTNNLIEHLLYDSRKRILLLFRHVGFLRAVVRKQCSGEVVQGEQKHLTCCMLPPQLVLESLVSTQSLLHPKSGYIRRADNTVEELLAEQQLDPCAVVSIPIRGLPDNFAYHFWAARLKKLVETLKQPPPATSSFMQWVEEHTSERDALTVAIIALILTLIFGFISILLGAAQLWISILAWKYPQT